ncbi:M56 family metallopeptidase [Blautia schinkii]|nr:M56 family metallopeptidase [Blautia schinkii]
MELTISGFWTALVIIIVMSIFLFFVTRNSDLYNTVSPTTVILCGLLVLVRVVLPCEIGFARDMYIPRIFPVLDSVIRYDIIKLGSHAITIWMIMLFIWCIAAVKKLYELICDYIKMCRIVELCDEPDSDLLFNIQKMQVRAGVTSRAITYKVSKLYGNPFVFGVGKPIIILPLSVSLRSEDELYMVLLHEWSHYKRKDGITKIVLEVFCRIFWWLPFIGVIKRRINEAMEIRADWNVIKNMQEDEKTQYMILLCEMSEIASANQGGMILSNTFIDGQISTMERRFEFINDKYRWGFKNVALLLISTVIFISSYFVILEPRYVPDDGTVNCKSTCYLYKQCDESYDVYMDGVYIGALNDINFLSASDFKDVEIKVIKEDER